MILPFISCLENLHNPTAIDIDVSLYFLRL